MGIIEETLKKMRAADKKPAVSRYAAAYVTDEETGERKPYPGAQVRKVTEAGVRAAVALLRQGYTLRACRARLREQGVNLMTAQLAEIEKAWKAEA